MKIKLRDYLRINGIITAILDNEEAKTERSCLFYASYGAYILHRHFQLNAVVVSGAAAYHLDDPENILFFGDIEDGHVTSHEKAFHAWVEVDGFLVDFMAPTFGRITSDNGRDVAYPARMLQKPMSGVKANPSELKKAGDVFLHPNPELTSRHASFLTTKPIFGGLADICVKWFQKAPRAIPSSISIQNQKGKMQEVQYKEARLSGVW